MPEHDKFRRLGCGEWNSVQGVFKTNPIGKFTVPGWGPFDFQAYANSISRIVGWVNKTTQMELENLWLYPHCKDVECTHKFFTYALRDTPVEIGYEGIQTFENRPWHIYEVKYARAYIAYMECQAAPIESAADLEHLRAAWEQVEEFVILSRQMDQEGGS